MRIVLIFLTLCLLCFTSRVAAYDYAWSDVGDNGYDRPFGDLSGMPVTAYSPSECQALCNQTDDCVAWAWDKPTCQGNLCWLKATIMPLSYNPCRVSGVKGAKLSPPMYSPLPLGSIKPQGWLANQFYIQANGLAGHLQDFWGDIQNSTWIGGPVTDPGEQERVPYWLNGMVPLVYSIDVPELQASIETYIDYILENQQPDSGFFGKFCCDPWPQFPLLFALLHYHEATQDPRVVPAVWEALQGMRYAINVNGSLDRNEWAYFRWQDLMLSIHYMYDNYANESQTQWLLDFSEELWTGGFDWAGFYYSDQFPTEACRDSCCTLATHGVNNGQAIKSSAVWYRQSQNTSQYEDTLNRINMLDTYHGQSSGIFACSEHLAGLNPSQGSETCTVCEAMFSYEVLFSVFGNVSFSDRVEMLTFNALPAALTPDMWAHVYLQQGNQIWSANLDEFIYVSDGGESNVYGLAPNFGCCTVNFEQGWPKYAQHLWMQSTSDGGLVLLSYAPSMLTTSLPSGDVIALVETNYPFEEKVNISIYSNSAFNLHLPIPSWSSSTTISVNGKQITGIQAGEIFIIEMNPESDEDFYTLIEIDFPMTFYTKTFSNGSISLYRGPFVYGLKIEEEWQQLAHYYMNSSDWEISAPSVSNWSIALFIPSNQSLEELFQFNYIGAVGDLPFSPNQSPIKVYGKGKVINWPIYENAADWPPSSPSSVSPLIDVTLIPFGATDLRIVQFPVISE